MIGAARIPSSTGVLSSPAFLCSAAADALMPIDRLCVFFSVL